MNKLFTFALAIVVCLGTIALLANGGRSARQGRTQTAQMEADGAFRDGLYVGRLAAESGRPLRPAIARWSGEQDRVLFVAGYTRGYNDSLAKATVLVANRPERN
jgi:hypothetical protein